MPQFFITQVEPLNLLRGQEVLFFIREQDLGQKVSRTHCQIKEIPHYFFTPYLPNEEIDQIQTDILRDPAYEKLNLSRRDYTLAKSFLQIGGSKELGAALPSPFLCKNRSNRWQDPCSLNSPTRQLRWFYPPMMLVDSLDNIPLPKEIEKRRFISLEQIITDDYAVLDIELEGWEKGQDQIFMVVYISPKRKIIFHDFKFELNEHHRFELISFQTPQELGNLVSLQFKEDDPLWIYGHNIMNFDQIKLRDLTKTYFPAVNQHYPVTKTVQGLGRVITKGRWTIDSYKYHFNYRNVLANNTLETVSEDLEKSINYQEQAKLVRLARNGDLGAFLALVDYCIEDGLATQKKGEELKPIVAKKSKYLRTYPDNICSTAKSTISREYWHRRYFIIKGVYEDCWKRQPKVEPSFSIDEFKKKFLTGYFKRGFFEQAHLIYLTPFLAGARNMLEAPDLELLERAKKAPPLEKFDLLQTLNAKVGFLIDNLSKILEKEGDSFNELPSEFSHFQKAAIYSLFYNHGLRKYSPLLLVREVSLALEKINCALQQYAIINRGNNFHLLENNSTSRNFDPRKLEESGYGIYLGSGKALSLSPERFIANPLQEKEIDKMIYQGVSLSRGLKCNFEKRMLEIVVQKIFEGEDFRRIKADLDQEIDSFLNGLVEGRDYVVQMKRRSYFKRVMGEILERADADAFLEYKSLSQNIGDRYSDETRKRMNKIISHCQGDFSFPFLLETLEEIEHPYPPAIDLVCCGNGFSFRQSLLPRSYGLPLQMERYQLKIRAQFKDFYEIFSEKKTNLKQGLLL